MEALLFLFWLAAMFYFSTDGEDHTDYSQWLNHTQQDNTGYMIDGGNGPFISEAHAKYTCYLYMDDVLK